MREFVCVRTGVRAACVGLCVSARAHLSVCTRVSLYIYVRVFARARGGGGVCVCVTVCARACMWIYVCACGETPVRRDQWSAYGLFRAHKYHLELN